MMRHIRLYLPAVLAVIITAACGHKELCYDHTHTVNVRVVFDWKNAPDAAPETMSAYFFPKAGGEPLRYEFTDIRGGIASIPFGTYDVIGMNSDTERLFFRNMDSRETFEVYTKDASLLAALGVRADNAPRAEGAEEERVVAAPDSLWCDCAVGIGLKATSDGQTVTLFPGPAVRRYTVEIRNAENLEYVKGLGGSLSGMACGLLPYGKVPTGGPCTIPFSAEAAEDMTGINGDLLTFGPDIQADSAHKIVIYAMLENGEKWYYTYDVTQQVRQAPDPYNVHIVLDGLPFPKPLVNGGGFRPGIDGWNEVYINIIL